MAAPADVALTGSTAFGDILAIDVASSGKAFVSVAPSCAASANSTESGICASLKEMNSPVAAVATPMMPRRINFARRLRAGFAAGR
jgi:hypothetical protein